MKKLYFLKLSVLLILLFCCSIKGHAQYAVGGTAGPGLTNSVFWLTWDKNAPGSTLVSVPQNADANHIINGTYIWQFSPSVRVTAVLSNETFTGGDKMIAYTPGNYLGDGLDLIYSGNNLPKPASRGVANSALATTDGETVAFDIDVKVSILVNSVWTDVNYPGMIIGDAESIDANSEYISGTTTNSIAWQLLNKRTTGSENDAHYKLQLSNSSKSFKLYADQPPGNFGVQAVMFARGAKALTNVTMKGTGLTAMAIGFMLPFDYGDNPESYGFPGSYVDDFKSTEALSKDGIYSVVNYDTTPLIPQATVYIGANNVDADGQPKYGVAATGDDLDGNDDESSLKAADLKDIKVNQAGDIALSVPVTNTKNVPATLYGWLDFNNDGVFEPNEAARIVVPANTSNQTTTLTFPNSAFSGNIIAGPLYLRLRITTTALNDDVSTVSLDERSVAYSGDGEIEDYKLKDVIGINVSGFVVNDSNGSLDNEISGKGVQAVSGHQLYAYLYGADTIVKKAIVGADGSYSFANVNNGKYTIGISINDLAIGSPAASVLANLPATYVPSGDSYGINNLAGTGIDTATPDLKIAVSTPGSGLDITKVNFGVDAVPIAIADAGATVIGQPITIDILANDADADGTLDLGKAMLVDPKDNVKKTSVTVDGQGNYNLSTTNSKVTFTPTATFIGKTQPISYTNKDSFGAESQPAPIAISVKPVGVPDSVTTPVNTPVIITVKSNDGPSGVGTTVTPVNGIHGKTIADADGKITYSPDKDFVGIDNYTYVLSTKDSIVSDPISVTVRVNAGNASFSLTKVANNTGIKAGDQINYTLIVTNTGTVPLSNITLADQGADPGSIVPATLASLAVGANATVTARHTLTQAEVNSGKFKNQAIASGTGPDGSPVTHPSDDPSTPAVNDSTVVLINPAPAISIVKTGSATANLINYSFVITNTGNVTLKTITLTDTKLSLDHIIITTPPAGLLPGASINYTSVYNLKQTDRDAGTVTNTATATGNDPGGNTVTGQGTAVTPVTRSPSAADDIAQTEADKPVNIEVLKNDNPQSSSFNLQSIEIMAQPTHGLVKLNGDGTVTYNPALGYTGLDVFTYRVKDVLGYYTNVANVNVTISFTGLVKIPNLFTPNGDGVNDVFEIRGLDQYAQNEITIVNRWGNEVYRKTNYKNDWSGERLNEGTYYYLLHVKKTTADEWQVYKGYTMLLRTFNR